MKVITFSTRYPGTIERTEFPEKIWRNFPREQVTEFYQKLDPELRRWFFDFPEYVFADSREQLVKGTTIRAGRHWKVGDKFSPRIWTGKPYNSKQLAFWPELTVLKVQIFERNAYGNFFLEGRFLGDYQVEKVAEHDGLTYEKFAQWFSKEFSGQRITFGQTALNYSIF